MERQNRLPYLSYLLWWCGVWMPITILAKLPECYESGQSLALGYHESLRTTLLHEFEAWTLGEAVCGFVWGSMSWGLHRWVLRWPPPPFSLGVAGQVAALETLVLAVPLSLLYAATINFMAVDDDPTSTISNAAIAVNVVGILLAFPLACLVAVSRSARKATPVSTQTVETSRQDDAIIWPPTPKADPPDAA